MKTFLQFLTLPYRRFTTTRYYAALIGAAALLWFLIRVLPKPQRAAYPCMRASFPLASAFVLWICGAGLFRGWFRKVTQNLSVHRRGHYTVYGICGLGVITMMVFGSPIKEWVARSQTGEQRRQAADLLRNEPNQGNGYKACVAVVQSEKDSACWIGQEEITNLIRQAVTLSGGFDTLIHEGDTVVLKPNMIGARDGVSGSERYFPPEANGVATDYRVIQSVVDLVREHNKSGMLVLLEASGLDNTRENFNRLGYGRITGLDSVILLDEFAGAWYDSAATDQILVALPEGQYILHPRYYLNNIYYKAQVLISLPVLKTHFLTGITGAVKNLGIGATPVRMYGNGPKVVASDQSGRWQMIPHWDFKGSVKPLDQWIHDYYLCRPADYVITDGIQGAQYGPFPGAGMGNSYLLPQVQMNMRLILAGSDALAVDAIHALITGNDPLLVGHLQLLALQGMGCIHPAFIQVKGTPVDRVKKRFKEVSPGNLSQYTDFEGSQAEIKWEARGQELTICSQEDWLYAEVHTSDTCIRINGAAASEPVTQKMPIAEPFELRLYDRFLNVTRWFSLSIQSGESER